MTLKWQKLSSGLIICRDVEMAKIVMRARKKKLGDWCEKSKDREQPLAREVCGTIDECEGGAVKTGVRNLTHFLEVFQHTLLTLFTLCCTWPTDHPKSTCQAY